MSTKPIKPAANILGYKLEKRIGSGGFGEVWSAEAPGGLKKALKIVYGFHDEKRAMSELKALDRVKSLRHPFLLSLERIEVFEGQLIVVTELADASLADHFNTFVNKGEPGIPREEMLRHMSNAANALDFLWQEKSLQHLDIKPENLLLVSGHVKVADFGLMKDLHAASQSMMQGMTPAYAAPELFDGHPAASSDQYSLAIMYCEMISGVRPFPGTTPAQLAAQHLHGKPNLRPVPRGDQAAVARALSKDPAVRYPSCSDFVEDLKKQRRNVRIARKRSETKSEDGSETLIFTPDQNKGIDATEMVSDRALPFQPNSIVSVEPPKIDAKDAAVQPTLIITIGQTANKVGEKFKAKLLMRAGDSRNVPSIRSIFIDSDRKDLAQLENNFTESVSPLETLEVPLRKPEDYRANAEVHLGWLSRRWIYNVPRTLQTEGLRPLGRLVFADHFSSICDRLEQEIGELIKAENLGKTADALKMNPGDPNSPRIYIISSISGGVGSGMMLDMAYTVKLLLGEKGLKHDFVTGVLLHSNYQRMRDPGLSSANAFAFLTELRHFNEQGYPGDASLGIPEFDEEPPFEHTYYTELGDDLNQSEFDARLDSVAEYISLSASTRCNEFFDACRKSEQEMEHFALRTFGVATSKAGDISMQRLLIDQLCKKLIQRWSGLDESGKEGAIEVAKGILSQLEVDEAGIEKKVRGEILSSRVESREELLALANKHAGSQEELRAMFDDVYGPSEGYECPESYELRLRKSMDQFLNTDPIAGMLTISKACYAMLNLEFLALGSIEATVEHLSQTMRQWLVNVEKELAEGRASINSTMDAIAACQTPEAMETPPQESMPELLARLCAQREDDFAKRIACEYIQIIVNDLQPVNTVIEQLKTNLDMITTDFTNRSTSFEGENGDALFDPQQLMLAQLESKLEAMSEQIERQVYYGLVAPEGGFQHVLTDYSILRYNLPSQLRTAAQQAICSVNESLSMEELIRENDVAPEQVIQWVNSLSNEAKPLVNDCGGRMRMLVGLPTNSEESQIPKMIESKCRLKNAAVNGTDGKLAICFEAEDLSLAAVAFRLLMKRPDAVELVKRIHSRDDVDWTTLDDLL